MALDILSTIIAAIFGFAHTATGLAALFLQKDLGLGFLLDTDTFDPPTVGGGEVIVGKLTKEKRGGRRALTANSNRRNRMM